MSSSRGNVIALTAEPNDMYGKVMSMGDPQVATYFELCTRVPMREVAEVMQGHPKDAKMRPCPRDSRHVSRQRGRRCRGKEFYRYF